MILCCGEALIDMIATPTVAGGDGFVPHSGGAVFNTAIALGRLGAPVGLLTGLSSDMFGEQLSEALQNSHVDASHVIRRFVILTEFIGQAGVRMGADIGITDA